AWYSTIESPEPALQFHGTFKKRKEIRSLKDIARTDLFRGPDKHGTWTYWSREGDLKAAGIWKAGKPWEGTCGIPLAGEAGSIAGVERFVLYRQGQAVPEEPSP
ncbi:MAG: hypothetical protein HYU43_00860, partial [Armatimonadetes bacterium]|nr:hypothetical protein [Armatimonadota bacterium]